MGTVVRNRTPKSAGRQSLFFQDLASPITTRKGRFSSPSGQPTTSASGSWREELGGSDLPPPPRFTLDDRSDFSPDSGISDYPLSPTEVKSDQRTLSPVVVGRNVATPSKSGSFSLNRQGSGSSLGWWALAKVGGSGEQEKEGKGSPVEGVVKPVSLFTVPPPREVARPEIVQRNPLVAGNLDEEEWVTVYGFPPGDTNLVLREFEKCGVILKHVPGPRDANWMHILYQNRSDAQKALSKNGMQISGVLIIGVKPVDPMQRQALNERLNNPGFMPLPPSSSSRTSEPRTLRASPSPYYLQNGNTSGRQTGGAIASPAKSVVSKIFDVMFGI